MEVFQRREARALVGAQIRLVGLDQEAVQTVDDHAPGFVFADLGSRRSHQVVLFLFRSPQVGLLALFGHPHGKATGVLNVLLDVVLAEGRIGEDAVVAFQLAVIILVLRPANGVFLPDVRVGDAVQEHVHLADGPGGADLVLAVERQIPRVSPAFLDVVPALDQHAAGAHRRVVDAHARLGLDDLDHRAHDVGRRVELPGLLAGGVGEVFDQVLVGCAQQIGELEVLVAQGDLLEVLDEVGQGVVVEGALADLLVEVDMLENVLQGVDVGVLESLERLVEGGAHVGLEVADFGPARFFRNVEGVLVRVFELRGDNLVGHALCLQLPGESLSFLIEEVGEPLQKEHAEDVLFVLRGIHVAAQVIAGAEDEAGELAECELGHLRPFLDEGDLDALACSATHSSKSTPRSRHWPRTLKAGNSPFCAIE